MDFRSRLALGTVQFGLKYGINNTRGQVSTDEVVEILKLASQQGIRCLDTAYAYGESEAVLGKSTSLTPFDIVSKFPAEILPLSPNNIFMQSLARLQCTNLYGYLLHNYHSFRDRLHLLDFLQELRGKGLVKKTGFSLYHPAELIEILEAQLPFELLQIPLSIFDQRFIPFLPELSERGIEIHTRSCFLQGLVFRDPESLPDFFQSAKPNLLNLRQIVQTSQLSLADLCLGFNLNLPQIQQVVIGVDSVDNLKENLNSESKSALVKPWLDQLSQLAICSEDIVNPAKWKLT